MITEDRVMEQGRYGNFSSIKPALKRKGVVLFVMLSVIVTASLIVYKYFYYLDAYFYTYEFYWLFNVRNLQAANIELFAEYFSPMGITTEALPQLIFSHFIQNYFLPLSKPILVAAATLAYGTGLGLFFSFLSLVTVGMLSFGLGMFLFGDILPFLKGGKIERFQGTIAGPAALSLPLLFSIPFIPISVIAIVGAAFKISLRRITQFMLIGFSLRLFLLLTMPFFYL